MLGLGERVAALSTAKLALLNLRVRERAAMPVEHPDEPHHAPAAISIPRLPREVDAETSALKRLDELSDAEVDELLQRALERQGPTPGPHGGGDAPDAIRRIARNREAELLDGLEGLSDAEVDLLLDELMPHRRAVAE